MILQRKEINVQDSLSTIYTDENDNIILAFESKSAIFGNKVAVYDKDKNLQYFIDENITSDYDEIVINKDNAEIVKLRISDNLLIRDILIEAKDAEYDFFLVPGILLRDGKRVAEVKPEGINTKSFLDNENLRKFNKDIEEMLDKKWSATKEKIKLPPKDAERVIKKREEVKEIITNRLTPKDIMKMRKINREVLKGLRDKSLEQVNNLEFSIQADSDEMLKYLLTMLYAIEFLVKEKLSVLRD